MRDLAELVGRSVLVVGAGASAPQQRMEHGAPQADRGLRWFTSRADAGRSAPAIEKFGFADILPQHR